VNEWLAYRRDFPDQPAAADLGLQTLFSDVRRQLSRKSGGAPAITSNEVLSLLPAARDAAEKQRMVPAMLLVAQYYAATDWPKAVEWYEKAGQHRPNALTRLGRLLVNHDPTDAALNRAWECYEQAAERGDLAAKSETGKGLFYGELIDGKGAGHRLARLADQRAEGARILHEVLSEARQPPAIPPYEDVEPTPKELAQLRVVLGSFYLEQLAQPSGDRLPWIAAKDPTELAATMLDLLREAAPTLPEAYDHLAIAAINGVGSPVNKEAAVAFWKQGIAGRDPGSTYNYAEFLRDRKDFAAMPGDARKNMMDAAKSREPRAIKFLQAAAEQGHAEAARFCESEKIPFQKKSPRPKTRP
jgi:TPR repeat protein